MNKLSNVHNSFRLVRKAEIKDIPEIISVLEQNLIANKTPQDPVALEQSGFLIHSFSHDDAKLAITDENNFIFLVTTENEDVIGYIIGCDVKKLKSEFQDELSSISSEIRNIIYSEQTLYLRHIAKKIEKKGVGREMLQELIDRSMRARYQYVICSIAEKPIQNKVSKNFHEKNGFVCVGFRQDADKTYGIYLKKI